MVSPIDVSEYFVKFFNDKGDYISHLKIQKLLYYTDCWYRVYFNDKLFEEQPQAWVHGPVYPSVYQQYKEFGANNIITNKSEEQINSLLSEIFSDSKKLSFINDILVHYGVKSAFTLELMTHNEIPWQVAREGYGNIEPCANEINMEFATEYYSSLIKNV